MSHSTKEFLRYTLITSRTNIRPGTKGNGEAPSYRVLPCLLSDILDVYLSSLSFPDTYLRQGLYIFETSNLHSFTPSIFRPPSFTMQIFQYVALLASAAMAAANSNVKRDSWGSAFSLGPAASTIIKTTTTIYPGAYPTGQEAYLFAWLGMSNGTGELIQSIIGSYPAGGSECGGQDDADTAWCISSEVYGSGYQYVGELTTADANSDNGILLTYELADEDTWLWTQTMEDAVTGTLLSSFNRTSGPMTGWGTALECNDADDGTACTGTPEEQVYANSTIILKSADSGFSDTMGVGTGVTHTDMETTDSGKTWTIEKITIPAMQSS